MNKDINSLEERLNVAEKWNRNYEQKIEELKLRLQNTQDLVLFWKCQAKHWQNEFENKEKS